MTNVRRFVLGSVVALVVAACSGGVTQPSGSPLATTSTAATSPASATPPPSAPASVPASEAVGPSAPPPASAAPSSKSHTITLPITTLEGTLDQPYPGFDRSKLDGLLPGGIKFDWFRSTGGTMVVVYFQGPLPAGVDPLCPGTSIKTASGFEDVTNSPLGTGGCKGDDKHLAQPPAGALICNDGFLVYVTTIPNDAVGTLYASLEKAQPDGSISGLTSATASGPKLATYPNQFDLSKYSCRPAG